MPAKRVSKKLAKGVAASSGLASANVPPSIATAAPLVSSTPLPIPHAQPRSASGKKYIVGLVDVNSSAHRVFQQWYALTTKMGMNIDLERYLRKQSTFVMNLAMTAVPPALGPEYSGLEHRAVACFDAGCGGREVLMPQYKANRPTVEAPEGLEASFEAFRTAIAELGDKVLTLPINGDKSTTNAEADDMIATAANLCKARGNPSVIITGDRDMMQLIDDGQMCIVYDTLKKAYFDEAAAQKRIGVLPRDMLAYKVLAGDSSDNIAGCAGVGTTRATKLVNKYRTMEQIIAKGQLDTDFPQKVRDALKAFAPHVALHERVMGLQDRPELKGAINKFLDK